MAPGAIGTMDFSVTSNNSDTLSMFGLGLQITLVGTPTSLLPFTTNQPDPYGNPNYVFFGQSFNQMNGPIPFWSAPFQSDPVTGYPNDSILGGDSANPLGSFVTIPGTPGGPFSSSPSVQFQPPLAAQLGDQFQISLVTGPNTFFLDQNGNPLNYTSSGGPATISSVPEPCSLSMALSGLGGVLWYSRRRRDVRSKATAAK